MILEITDTDLFKIGCIILLFIFTWILLRILIFGKIEVRGKFK